MSQQSGSGQGMPDEHEQMGFNASDGQSGQEQIDSTNNFPRPFGLKKNKTHVGGNLGDLAKW